LRVDNWFWLFCGMYRYESIIGSTQLHVLLTQMTILKIFLKRNLELISAERYRSVCVCVCVCVCERERDCWLLWLKLDFALGPSMCDAWLNCEFGNSSYFKNCSDKSLRYLDSSQIRLCVIEHFNSLHVHSKCNEKFLV